MSKRFSDKKKPLFIIRNKSLPLKNIKRELTKAAQTKITRSSVILYKGVRVFVIEIHRSVYTHDSSFSVPIVVSLVRCF